MFTGIRFQNGKKVFFLGGLILSLAIVMRADEGKNTSSDATTNQLSGEALQIYLQVQEELRATRLTLERNRQEAASAATRADEILAARLKGIEQSLNSQHDETWNKSNRLMLVLMCVFGGLGLIALLTATWLHWRATKKFAEVLTASRASALGAGHAATELGASDMHLAPLSPPEQADTQLLGTIERLEKRIHELEQTADTHQPGSERPKSGGKGRGAQQVQATDPKRSNHIMLLLGKGQSLLHLNSPQEALACFDEVLAIDPANAEALLKKGSALERLEKLNEAIACYDRAIAVDHSLTIAYLHKGGVFNRLELYSQALECYEQALRTREQGRA